MLTPKQKLDIAIQKGYHAKDGKIFKNDRELKIKPDGKGYPRIRVYHNVTSSSFEIRVHRLVAYIKYKDAIFCEGIVVRHLDNNRLNFLESNIAIGSMRDNYYDTPKDKLIKPKLKPEDIHFIRSNKGKIPNVKLAKMFNVHPKCTYDILNNKTYKYIEFPQNINNTPIDHAG